MCCNGYFIPCTGETVTETYGLYALKDLFNNDTEREEHMASKGPSTLEPDQIEEKRTAIHGSPDAGSGKNPYPELDLDAHGPAKSHWWVWVLILGAIAFGCYRLYVFETAKQSAMARPSKSALLAARPATIVGATARTGNMPV